MIPDTEWYREQSEYNRRVYERLVADYDDMADWKVVALFYSGMHRVNYRFAKRTGRVPTSHISRNRRVERDLPEEFDDYRDLYMESRRARYRDGHGPKDARRGSAAGPAGRIEDDLPFWQPRGATAAGQAGARPPVPARCREMGPPAGAPVGPAGSDMRGRGGQMWRGRGRTAVVCVSAALGEGLT